MILDIFFPNVFLLMKKNVLIYFNNYIFFSCYMLLLAYRGRVSFTTSFMGLSYSDVWISE